MEFFQSLLVIAVFLVGWGMSFTSIDLNSVSNMPGTIMSSGLEQNKGSKSYPGQMNLVIHLDSDKNGFWIYRTSQDYSDLLPALFAGVK